MPIPPGPAQRRNIDHPEHLPRDQEQATVRQVDLRRGPGCRDPSLSGRSRSTRFSDRAGPGDRRALRKNSAPVARAKQPENLLHRDLTAEGPYQR